MTSPKSQNSQLPTPVKGASEVAKLTTNIASAVMSIWFPVAALGAPLANYLIDRSITKGRDILVSKLKEGGVDALSVEQWAEFVPMAYRFFEAVKEGEYEHNLKILAAFMAKEVKRDVPEAPNFARMVRRLEGVTRKELALIALVEARMEEFRRASKDGFVCASNLADCSSLDQQQRHEALTELASRGLLIPDGASRSGKNEEYYRPTEALRDLIAKARAEIEEAGLKP